MIIMDKKVNDILNNRRLQAQITANINFNTACLIPNFKKKYSEYKSAIIENARKKVLENKINDNTTILKIKNQLNKMLQEKNLSLNDLQPSYYCSKCCDTGFVNGEQCLCVKEILNTLNKSNFSNKSLHSFNDANMTIFENDTMPKLYKLLKAWCNNQKNIKNILLQGGTGVGKTFLIECLATEFLKQGKYVVFSSAFEINNDFLKYHTTFDENKISFLEKYLDCDVLVIDDLGTEPIFKNITKEYFYLLFNQRMVDNKINILSTNLDLINIKERYGDRIFSRILSKQNGRAFNINHSDLRLKK